MGGPISHHLLKISPFFCSGQSNDYFGAILWQFGVINFSLLLRCLFCKYSSTEGLLNEFYLFSLAFFLDYPIVRVVYFSVTICVCVCVCRTSTRMLNIHRAAPQTEHTTITGIYCLRSKAMMTLEISRGPLMSLLVVIYTASLPIDRRTAQHIFGAQLSRWRPHLVFLTWMLLLSFSRTKPPVS